MKVASTGGASQQARTRVVEIIGPAGAGKTTLYHALACYTDSFQMENFPDVREVGDAPFFISNGLLLIPALLPLFRRDSRQLTRREFAWMTILKGWSTLLRRQANEYNKVMILDQGPVYLLAEMRLFGPEYLKQKTAERLWQDLYDRWSAVLDMVICLDTADDVLFDRIRNRLQEHSVKDQPAAIAFAFLDRYRAEYESILSRLTSRKAGLKVLKFDTGCQQTQDIVGQLVSELSD